MEQLANCQYHQIMIKADPDLFEKWLSVGRVEGLSSDTKIASLLIQLYKNKDSHKDREQGGACLNCRAALPRVCPSCLQSITFSQQHTSHLTQSSNCSQQHTGHLTQSSTLSQQHTGHLTESSTLSQQQTGHLTQSSTLTCSQQQTGHLTHSSTLTCSQQHTDHLTLPSSQTHRSEATILPDMHSFIIRHQDVDSGETKATSNQSVHQIAHNILSCTDLHNFVNYTKTKEKQIPENKSKKTKVLKVKLKTLAVRLQRTSDIQMQKLKTTSNVETFTHSQAEREKYMLCNVPFPDIGIQTVQVQKTQITPDQIITNEDGTTLYVCEVCGATFKEKGKLLRHHRIHTGEKPFQCTICLIRFARDTDLARHHLSHSPDRPWVCDTCGVRYKHRNNLADHVKTHRQKEHTCTQCPAAFFNTRDLQIHLRSHTGELPFGCELCGHMFSRLSSLVKHRDSHEGRHPFPCRLCPKTFSQTNAIKRHMLTVHRVSNNEIFACSLCGQTFAKKRDLKQHVKVAHHGPSTGAENLGAESGQNIKESGQNIKESGQNIKESGQNIKESGQNIKESGQNIKESRQNIKESGQNIKESGQNIKEMLGLQGANSVLSLTDSTLGSVDMAVEDEVHQNTLDVNKMECHENKSGLKDDMSSVKDSLDIVTVECHETKSSGNESMFSLKDCLEIDKLEYRRGIAGNDSSVSSNSGLTVTQTRKSSLRKRRPKNKSDRKKSVCDACGLTLSSQSCLSRHRQQVHHKKSNFVCTDCSKSFARRYTLKQHILLIHRHVRQHTCSQCGYVFGNRHHLKRHSGFQKPGGSFRCPDCRECFSCNRQFLKHLKSHPPRLRHHNTGKNLEVLS